MAHAIIKRLPWYYAFFTRPELEDIWQISIFIPFVEKSPKADGTSALNEFRKNAAKLQKKCFNKTE